MRREFPIIIEASEEGGFIGYCPEVPGANGQGETIEDCKDEVREAIKLLLQVRLEAGLRGVPEDAIHDMVVVD